MQSSWIACLSRFTCNRSSPTEPVWRASGSGVRAGPGTAPAGRSGPVDFSRRREKSTGQIHGGGMRVFFPYHKRVRFANLMPQSDLSRGRYRSMDFCAAASAIISWIARDRSRAIQNYEVTWHRHCMCTACHVYWAEYDYEFDYEYHWDCHFNLPNLVQILKLEPWQIYKLSWHVMAMMTSTSRNCDCEGEDMILIAMMVGVIVIKAVVVMWWLYTMNVGVIW